MEINVTIIKILETVSGVSSKNGEAWVKNSFVGETQGNYPRKLCFTVMGDELWKKMRVVVGETCTVSFDPESHEWKGKYFSELKAWKVVSLSWGHQQAQTQQTQVSAPTPAPSPVTQNNESDVLPF